MEKFHLHSLGSTHVKSFESFTQNAVFAGELIENTQSIRQHRCLLLFLHIIEIKLLFETT